MEAADLAKGDEIDVLVWEINVYGSLPEGGVGGGKRRARAYRL